MQVRRIAPTTAPREAGQTATTPDHASTGSERDGSAEGGSAPRTALPRHRLIEGELWLTLLRAIGMAPGDADARTRIRAGLSSEMPLPGGPSTRPAGSAPTLAGPDRRAIPDATDRAVSPAPARPEAPPRLAGEGTTVRSGPAMTESETTLGGLFPESGADGTLRVSGLADDSRKVEEGFAFVAVPGTRANGAAFIADALARGAVAIVGEIERPPTLFPEIPYVRVPDSRRSLAQAAARMHPGQPETIVAVTGTSGKSSVAEFTRQLFQATGRESASLGTIGIVTRKGGDYGSLTTPDPITLHQNLDRLARDGITHLAMEASSHGIDQRRLDGVRLAAAGFTNLGRDHLDYHPSVEEYLEAKLRLFRELLPEGRPAVINLDGAESQRVADVARERGHRVLTVGRKGEFIRLLDVERTGFAQRLRLRVGGREIETKLPLVGAFQVENALVAAGLVLATSLRPHPEVLGAAEPRRTQNVGASFEADLRSAPQDEDGGDEAARVLAAFARLTGVPGRLERIGEVNGALCIVDYAHKPEALATVLDTLRPFASGRLVCVFGCGGDRDRGKRPLMGAIAAEKADLAIVTDDNPRSEDPASIRAAILAAAPGAREIGDRREAIRAAVAELGPGDVLVVAGKGHETGQLVAGVTLPFSDHDELRAAMEARA